MKKKWIMMMISSLLCLQGMSYAGKKDDSQNQNSQTAQNTECSRTGNAQFNRCDCNPCDCNPCGYCPESACCAPCNTLNFNLNLSGNFSGSIDWLFWKVRRCQPFAASFHETGNSFSVKSKNVYPKYHSGFRIGLGFNPCNCDCLEFGVVYTRFCHDQSSKGTTAIPEIFDEEIGALSYKGKFEFDYNIVDLLFATRSQGQCCSTFRPFIGVRLAYVDEKLKSSFYAADYIDLVSTGAYINEKLDLNAYGLITGFDYTRCLTNCCLGINFYTRASFSLLVGRFDFHEKGVFEENSFFFDEEFYSKVSASCNRLLSTQELAVGLEAVYNYCGCNSLKVTLGYEFHNWLNYSNFLGLETLDPDYYSLPRVEQRQGSLGLDGVYLRFASTF